MSRALQAADDVKALAARFERILSLAEVLEEIGSLDESLRVAGINARKAREVEKKADEMRQDSLRELSEVKKEIEARKETCRNMIEEAKRNGADIIQQAEYRASRIISEAQEKEKVIRREGDDLLRRNQELEEQMAKAEADLAAIKEEIRETRHRIESL